MVVSIPTMHYEHVQRYNGVTWRFYHKLVAGTSARIPLSTIEEAVYTPHRLERRKRSQEGALLIVEHLLQYRPKETIQLLRRMARPVPAVPYPLSAVESGRPRAAAPRDVTPIAYSSLYGVVIYLCAVWCPSRQGGLRPRVFQFNGRVYASATVPGAVRWCSEKLVFNSWMTGYGSLGLALFTLACSMARWRRSTRRRSRCSTPLRATALSECRGGPESRSE